jgi:hypothetical protein
LRKYKILATAFFLKISERARNTGWLFRLQTTAMASISAFWWMGVKMT